MQSLAAPQRRAIIRGTMQSAAQSQQCKWKAINTMQIWRRAINAFELWPMTRLQLSFVGAAMDQVITPGNPTHLWMDNKLKQWICKCFLILEAGPCTNPEQLMGMTGNASMLIPRMAPWNAPCSAINSIIWSWTVPTKCKWCSTCNKLHCHTRTSWI